MRYRWRVAAPNGAAAKQLAKEGAIHPLLAQCLVNRGFKAPTSVASFLAPRLKELADPTQLPDMDVALDRLWSARDRGERLVIFGDYDVDGVTSSALLRETLRALGWQVDVYLPHRLEEGYGLSQDGLANCLERYPTRLILAVDCGSTAVQAIDWLQQRGVEVIVLDHHQVSDPPPKPLALVNPQRNRDGTHQELCSAGLAFKLAHGLVKRGREIGCPMAADYDVRYLLDLVALGTIADLVPLVGENRILTTKGLTLLNSTRRPGIQALKEVTRSDRAIGVYEVGFQLAPRLNAAGRLENALDAFTLLVSEETEGAQQLATQLDQRNRKRQQIERGITDDVLARLRESFCSDSHRVIVEADPSWHIGVVGIVASRVLREYYRPTIIIGGEGDEWHGSGRSIEGFDLAAALRDSDEWLERHGGHAMAAGLSIRPDQVDGFREHLNRLAHERIRPDDLRPVLDLDAEVTLGNLTVEVLEELARLQPTGQGNPKILLVARKVRHQRPPRPMGRDQQHVKLWVTDGRNTVEVVWWGGGGETRWPEDSFDIAFEPQINEFRGERNVQLRLLDWQPSTNGAPSRT